MAIDIYFRLVFSLIYVLSSIIFNYINIIIYKQIKELNIQILCYAYIVFNILPIIIIFIHIILEKKNKYEIFLKIPIIHELRYFIKLYYLNKNDINYEINKKKIIIDITEYELIKTLTGLCPQYIIDCALFAFAQLTSIYIINLHGFAMYICIMIPRYYYLIYQFVNLFIYLRKYPYDNVYVTFQVKFSIFVSIFFICTLTIFNYIILLHNSLIYFNISMLCIIITFLIFLKKEYKNIFTKDIDNIKIILYFINFYIPIHVLFNDKYKKKYNINLLINNFIISILLFVCMCKYIIFSCINSDYNFTKYDLIIILTVLLFIIMYYLSLIIMHNVIEFYDYHSIYTRFKKHKYKKCAIHMSMIYDFMKNPDMYKNEIFFIEYIKKLYTYEYLYIVDNKNKTILDYAKMYNRINIYNYLLYDHTNNVL